MDIRHKYNKTKEKCTTKEGTTAPTETFTWKQNKGPNSGQTRFIIDTGSQINIMRTDEATKHGINAEKSPKILLNICGIVERLSGAKMAIWKRLCINIKSETTGKQHLEEVYLSENTQFNDIRNTTKSRIHQNR